MMLMTMYRPIDLFKRPLSLILVIIATRGMVTQSLYEMLALLENTTLHEDAFGETPATCGVNHWMGPGPKGQILRRQKEGEREREREGAWDAQ